MPEKSSAKVGLAWLEIAIAGLQCRRRSLSHYFIRKVSIINDPDRHLPANV